MREIWVSLALAVALAPGEATAQCDPAAGIWSSCTAGDVYNAAFDAAASEVTDVTKQNLYEAEEKVANAPAATTAPSSFAGRIHGSYEDFLKLLAFAVNDVDESDDGRALVVRLNPLRHGAHRLGVTVTVAEPEISDEVQNAISEDGRADTVALLEKSLEDFDDLTVALSYSWHTERCAAGLASRRRCFGRDPASYSALLSQLIPAPGDAGPSIEDLRALSGLFAGANAGVFSAQLATDRALRRDQVEALQAVARADAEAATDYVARLNEAGVDLFWPLIDNQPQLAITLSKRNADPFVGQEYESAALELQFGGTNVNRLFGDCAVDDWSCPRERLARLAEEKSRPGTKLTDGKWVLSATYLERDAYAIATLPVTDPPGEFTPFRLVDSSELRFRAQWGALISSRADGWTPRIDFSAEGLETRDDGIRTKSRWVATATLTLPVAEGVVIPVSLNYANKPEFLGEQDESFGAHVGLSYRLPFGDE